MYWLILSWEHYRPHHFSAFHTVDLCFAQWRTFAEFLIFFFCLEHCMHLKAWLWLVRRSNKKSTMAQVNECRLNSSSLVILCCTVYGLQTFLLTAVHLPRGTYRLSNCSFVRASARRQPKYLVTKTQEGDRLLQFSLQLQVLLDVVGAYLQLPSADQVYRSVEWDCGCSLAKVVQRGLAQAEISIGTSIRKAAKEKTTLRDSLRIYIQNRIPWWLQF